MSLRSFVPDRVLDDRWPPVRNILPAHGVEVDIMAIALTQNRGLITGMNVTPLIDVLLVLLIIFMVITPTQPVGLGAAIPSPAPDQPRVAGPDRTIVVQIDKALGITINSESTDLQHLGQRLAEIFKSRGERVVFLKADPDLEFGQVATAIDIVKGAGIETIGLLGDRL